MNQFNYCHTKRVIGSKNHYNINISNSQRNMKKGLNIDVTSQQYQFLYDVLMEAYANDVAEQKDWDVQTFDNLIDNVCNAKETYLSVNCKGVRQIVEGKIELQEGV